ncbi:hypothetical protein BDV32DRAFT_121452 [Aspergillus pseudonomiae]|nr:hypothetical protein BDV32DRAFT_121452 [Aspergillus pseudonomiae]
MSITTRPQVIPRPHRRVPRVVLVEVSLSGVRAFCLANVCRSLQMSPGTTNMIRRNRRTVKAAVAFCIPSRATWYSFLVYLHFRVTPHMTLTAYRGRIIYLVNLPFHDLGLRFHSIAIDTHR